MVPKRTDPMAKFIRTGEGVLVFAFNIALVVVPIVSNSLSAAESAKWATIIDGIAVVSRTGLKMVAAVQTKPTAEVAKVAEVAAYSLAAGAVPAALGAPTSAGQGSGVVAPQVSAPVGRDIAGIEQLVADAEEFASTPSAADSAPTPSSSPGATQEELGVGGSNSHSNSPFLVRLGD